VRNAIHRLGATIFKALGVMIIASIFLPPRFLLWALLGGTVVASLALIVYSYVLHESETRTKEQRR